MASYWYRTGTATLTQGSKVVTISGAQLASAGLSAGDMFTRDGGQWYEIERIDGSEVTLASPYAGESEAEAPYAVIRLTFLSTTNAQLAVRLANLLHDWQQRESQLREWHGGTLDGGPNGDGRYPLSDGLGNTHLVPCPAWFGRAAEMAYDFEQELDRVLTARDQAVSARDDAVPAAQTAEQAAQATGEDRAAVAGMKQAAEAAATTATHQAGIATTKASEAAGSAQQAIDAAAAVGLPNPVIPDSFLRATPDGAGYKAVTAQQLAEALRPTLGVSQIVNLLPDSGRFAGRINPLSTQFTAAFEPSPFFSPINGATIASGGKFIYDNSTFGGTGGALTQDVQDLLAAMGRGADNGRYGVEFYIATITAGSGTGVQTIGADGVTRYLVTINNNQAVLGADGFVRCAMWMRVVSGSVHINAAHYINGVSRGPGEVLPAGWRHVLVEWFSPNGYDNAFPWICAVPGSVIQIACPIVIAGRVFVGIHTAPVATINEASS